MLWLGGGGGGGGDHMLCSSHWSKQPFYVLHKGDTTVSQGQAKCTVIPNTQLVTCKSQQCLTIGWGKITSLNFKVNNKKTIRDIKILFLDSETTTWEVLNHTVLKRISCKSWPLFACRVPGRLQYRPSDSLDVLWCSRSVVVLIFFQTHLPFP